LTYQTITGAYISCLPALLELSEFFFGLSSVFTVELDLLPFLELEILLSLLHLWLHLSLRSPDLSLLSLIINVLERGPHLVKTGQWRHNELIFFI
jgi:hypothetical protein